MLNQYIKNSLYAAALLGFATACEPEIERDEPVYEEARGEADFSTYVALGNSLTAGYADNALYREAQLNSYPAIIAEKIQYINPSLEFNQPLMPEGNGVGFAGGQTIGRLELTSTNPLALGPTIPSQGWETPVTGPIHNLGVPGATVGQLLFPGFGNPANGPGNFNPYYTRFATNAQASVLEQAIALQPTFFTLWIGNNDVLGYATAGGAGTSSITPPEQFSMFYSSLVNSLVTSNTGVEGALANIADITKIPFFNTIAYNQLVLTAEQAALANASYEAQINPNIDAMATEGVIRTVVTETALKSQIIPGVARAIVKQQVAASSTCNASPDPEACAEAVIQSGVMDAQIEGLRALLTEEYFKEEDERDPDYTQAYAAIDATLEASQSTIDQNVEQTIQAYNAEQLPAEQQAALGEAIDSVFTANVNQLQAAGYYPVFEEGPNEFVIEDNENPANPLGIREIREGELLLLSGQIAGLYTPTTAAQPKPDAYVLTASEITEIKDAVSAYNNVIAEVANEHTLALVDMNSFFNTVAEGYSIDGTTFTPAFITGNAFSLDGVHLTQKGYALVARRFIETINSYYNSSIPVPNTRNYPAVGLP